MDGNEVVRELNELRRGRGLEAADLEQRVGPRLRAASGITETDHAAAVRRKLVLRLTELCGRLPPDLQLAALVALALHEEAVGESLDRRIAWLADRFGRDARTARRRIDEAFRRLGQYLEDDQHRSSDNSGYAPDSWYVESLKAVLRMDLNPPQLTEERSIVATVDELDEIVVSLSAPRDTSNDSEQSIAAQMIYGGEIVETHHPARGHARFVIRLPEPLGLGHRHEYGIQFTSYPRSWIRPYCVLSPLNRCEYFSVRVKFGHDSRPRSMWRLNGTHPRVVDDFMPNDDLLTLNRVGEVFLEFHALQRGLSYGLQWSTEGNPGG